MDFGDHFFLEWIVFYKSVIRPTNTVTNATPMDASTSNDADLPFSSIPRYSIADQWNPRIDTTLSIGSTFFFHVMFPIHLVTVVPARVCLNTRKIITKSLIEYLLSSFSSECAYFNLCVYHEYWLVTASQLPRIIVVLVNAKRIYGKSHSDHNCNANGNDTQINARKQVDNMCVLWFWSTLSIDTVYRHWAMVINAVNTWTDRQYIFVPISRAPHERQIQSSRPLYNLY